MKLNSNNLFEFDKTFDVGFLVGTDEAGRGPAAGGVFASAVHINDLKIEKELSKLNDSKKLSKKIREELYDIIKENTINSVVCVEVEEIEEINILNASLKAMKLACNNILLIQPILPENSLTLVDGNKLIKEYMHPQKFIIKGDGTSASIAAASILAKVERDRYMEKLDEEYPQYLWQKNAGYLTKEHISAIKKYGITPYHRKSFLKNILVEQIEQLSLI